MRASLFLNLLRALTGFSVSPSALDVKRGVVSKNAPSANALASGKLHTVLNALTWTHVKFTTLSLKDIPVAEFTYIVTI